MGDSEANSTQLSGKTISGDMGTSTGNSSMRSLNDLPRDLLEDILHLAGAIVQARIRFVCKYWNAMIMSAFLRKHLCIDLDDGVYTIRGLECFKPRLTFCRGEMDYLPTAKIVWPLVTRRTKSITYCNTHLRGEEIIRDHDPACSMDEVVLYNLQELNRHMQSACQRRSAVVEHITCVRFSADTYSIADIVNGFPTLHSSILYTLVQCPMEFRAQRSWRGLGEGKRRPRFSYNVEVITGDHMPVMEFAVPIGKNEDSIYITCNCELDRYLCKPRTSPPDLGEIIRFATDPNIQDEQRNIVLEILHDWERWPYETEDLTALALMDWATIKLVTICELRMLMKMNALRPKKDNNGLVKMHQRRRYTDVTLFIGTNMHEAFTPKCVNMEYETIRCTVMQP